MQLASVDIRRGVGSGADELAGSDRLCADPVFRASTPLRLVSADVGDVVDVCADAPQAQLVDLVVRTSSEHAQALLSRLQLDGVVGAVRGRHVMGIYHDMLIEMGWAERPWPQVGKHLRLLAGARKRYVNESGGKVCVYDIPDPARDEFDEMASRSRSAGLSETSERSRPAGLTDRREAA